MRERKLTAGRFLAWALVPMLLWTMTACNYSPKQENLEAFQAAVLEQNYPLAGDIYTEAAIPKDFDAAPYVTSLVDEVGKIRTEFASGAMDFDQAILALEGLRFHADLSERIAPNLAEARAEITKIDDIDESLELARIFALGGDYRQSLEQYATVLQASPEHAEARTAQASVLGEFTAAGEAKAAELLTKGFPRTALYIVEQGLLYDSGNQALAARKTEIEKAIADKDAAIKAEIPRFELNLLLRDGKLKDAQEYLDQLAEQGIDTAPLQPLLDERIDLYISAVIASASDLASAALSGRWPAAPYSKAIAKLNEGLALYPNNKQLQAAKTKYQNASPDNTADNITILQGNVQSDATGSDAGGYTYRSGGFDSPLLVKPDTIFTYEMGGYDKTRIVFSPKSADNAVYSNMAVIVKVDGDTVYSEEPFENSLKAVTLNLNVSKSSVIRVTVQQSGFASFFDSIIGRNSVFIELYRLP